VFELDPGWSGVEQHHCDQRAERHESDHEEQDEVPPVAGRFERRRRPGGRLREVGDQGGKVGLGHRGEGRGAALVELLKTEPAHGGVPLQGPQDGVAVVVRRPQCWLRHGVSVLDNAILWIVHGGCVMPVVSSQPIEGEWGMASGKQLIIERILRDRAGIWDQIIAERDLPRLILRMLLTSVISLAAYGAVLGASNGWLQALVSTVKLPLLFLVTLAICLPTLYLFNLVFGARLSVLQACALIMVAITVTAVLTFAFAPISLFFLITARSYAFFKLLNVAILALTALVGLRFLTSGMRALNKQVVVESMLSNQVVATADVSQRELVSATVGGAADLAAEPPTNGDARTARQNQNAANAKASQPAAGDRPASMLLLYIWILLFGFVGTQLAWTLRPFFGNPREPFELFRDIDGTFYGDILSTLGSLLG
jgi:hypothetical protein